MGSSVLESFAKNVAAKTRYGIGWETIIAVLLPVILECFQNPQQMRGCCENPTFMQAAGLRIRVRRELRGSVGRFQLAAAVSDCCDALLAQAKTEATSPLMQGADPFEAAFEEARIVAGQ